MGFSFRDVRRSFQGLFGRARRLSGKTRCSVCMKYYKSNLLKNLPNCFHSYCRLCLRRTFSRLLLEPESIIPPRCCGHEITIATAGDFLDGVENSDDKLGLKDQYLHILETRTNDPVFCSRGCTKADFDESKVGAGVKKGWFILPEDIKEEQDLAICGRCGRGTCTLCKKPAPHKAGSKDGACGVVGENEKEEIRYRRLSGRNGWRCCEECGMMVSRDVGCAHVVCRCGNDVWLAF